ncbi:hypothetical protein ACNHUS_13275 [Actinomycetes bacterium M1A6_2h]
MSSNNPFNFDPEDFDRVAREASEGLRDVFGQIMKVVGQSGSESPLAGMFGGSPTATRVPQPETTGDTGDGVWAIYTLDADGSARIDQLYATELDALRAHKDNVDTSRRVRFLPYGVTVSVLDDIEARPED